ncbi:trehalose-phosphatase [Brevibacterium spongiae]|uniref:Trehalose-phosphate phosphatase n=1 Tax=Brevibacterium spongiae TaxID=2909672 RepID=A0ABY5SQY3_9MICO|nr:trehalose-phosphatase [Brevibacterium spongiae]UVI35484.1 hypothetical protein L1F31_15375 [Brevibacterium spongiae]
MTAPAQSTPAEVDLRECVPADSLLVALDFDGVLAPLQDDPETSRMTAGSAAAIDALARLPRTRVALVSGRDIATLRRLTETPESVWMIGSHGAEADLGSAAGRSISPETTGSSGATVSPGATSSSGTTVSPELTAAEAEMLAAIDDHLDAFEHMLPEDISGVLIEDKPYSRTVHTRGLTPAVAAALHDHATAVAAEFPAIRVIEGHDITELAVKQATKGDGLRLLARAGRPSAMVYLGDDVTDEDAFAALAELTAASRPTEGTSDGPSAGSSAGISAGNSDDAPADPSLDASLSVKVGTAATAADWRIADPEAVAALLRRLARERADHLGAGRT